MKINAPLEAVVQRLVDEFDFKESKDHLNKGRCPSCNKKELHTPINHPWIIRCGRLNNCGYEELTRDVLPDLFEDINKKHPATASNPNATADAYMNLHRGLSTRQIKGAYRQSSFFSQKTNQGTATVLFDIDRANGIAMERFVDTLIIPDEHGEPQERKQNFIGSHYGLFWNNPLQTINKDDTVYITEAK